MEKEPKHDWTPEELRAQRRKALTLALALAAFVLLSFFVSLARMSGG